MFNSKKFIEERHKALSAVLYGENLKPFLIYCHKYRVPIPKDKKVVLVGVYKAIQQCNDFNENEKKMAHDRCIELGFSPDFKG